MKLFPAFLDLANRPCLVVGAGRVGLDKTKSLVAADASVLVVDPSPSKQLLAEATGETRIAVESRPFHDEDCRGRLLVFACTNRADVNDAVAAAAEAAGALCCRADGGAGGFTTGAALRRGALCVAVSSGGVSPGLAMEARDRIAAAVGPEFAEAAILLGRLRERLGAHVADGAARSKALGGSLVRDVVAALVRGEHDKAEAIVEKAFASARRAEAKSREGRCTR